MEENNKAKEVNMNNENNQKVKKLTYEQLNDACNQLWQQNKKLVERNRELERFIIDKRLDYLFKVLENSSKFTTDFVGDCSAEIENALAIPQENEETKKEQ